MVLTVKVMAFFFLSCVWHQNKVPASPGFTDSVLSGCVSSVSSHPSIVMDPHLCFHLRFLPHLTNHSINGSRPSSGGSFSHFNCTKWVLTLFNDSTVLAAFSRNAQHWQPDGDGGSEQTIKKRFKNLNTELYHYWMKFKHERRQNDVNVLN